ncbi:asparagine synthase (glutamine-hydrolyzing) [Endozoicomonas sp. SM1973]|uniref:asparagine synthase (glutamine-hydrolyzing) n=1 Tax=Spartinivicinus marinus TaxID=2994442 RepID=A0A853I7F5_9GAMM|nr:asparagine synthase (glutamine-hydrolyzing) [Spartinivicinus marinus]MCX4028809.1 asparagine synthase (glutamine-hydrolyzing) [Spartinivicinus marinus]NYZ67622.1 asparagine synthase (glutamine-hydrolyzing) [Spartinivicinus marinus]
MCGILGIASKLPLANQDWFSEGSIAMSHRGPDDAGEWWTNDRRVGLAHRRLSIIDLSSAAHQPMSNVMKSLTIVFNGEIYNYKELQLKLSSKGQIFKSNSDTEVILAAYNMWGVDCVKYLIGMFAFAIFDTKAQSLFLARDRAGEKPLFYHHVKGVFCFASELKSLMANRGVSHQIDMGSLDCYLAMGFVPGEQCILKGFKKLPPAHALLFKLNTGEVKVWSYWRLPEFNGKSNSSMDKNLILDELENLLESSVGQQLTADVPVGVLLSGGVDSSLITAMAARKLPKVKTFTIRFPGHGKLDETEHARLIAKYYNTEHVELEAKATTADLLPKLARQFDEPIIDSSMIPTYLVSQLVRQHCTVALGGDGGDELFGGYRHYSRLLWMQNHLGGIPYSLRLIISNMAQWFLPVGFKGRNWLQGLDMDLKYELPLIASYYDKTTRRKLLTQLTSSWPLIAEEVDQKRVPKNTDLLQRATRMDFANYLPEDILVKVDRTSMLNSLEVRAPFLDYRLIEFAFCRIPSYLKATATSKKLLLKELASRILPPEFDQQRKQGFSIPLSSWLKAGSFRELFHDVLLSTQTIFDQRIVRSLLRGQDLGRNNSERLFALVLFELWRREYAVTI